VTSTAAKYDMTLAERADAERERAAVRLFIAELRSGLLTAQIERLEADDQRLKAEQDTAKERQRALSEEHDSLIEERARVGGDRIGELERLAREAHGQAAQRRTARTRFDDAVSDAGLAPVTGPEEFAHLTTTVAEERTKLIGAKRGLDAAFADAITREKDLERRRDVVAEELRSLEQRTSNLPAEQVEVRAQLCHDLQLTPEELPYAGELLDVHEDHAQWRGAAERVLRGFALSLLVPQRHYEAVAGWVNARRLTVRGRGDQLVGARLTYERVPDRRLPLQSSSEGMLLLADCLEVKEGLFREYLAWELSRRADHRCASTLEEFRGERKAVTREGQVRSGDRHEKDDRHLVDDPRRWVLGWANERKIAALRSEFDGLETDRAQAAEQVAGISVEREAVQARMEALGRLGEHHSWQQLDFADAQARAQAHDEERTRLVAGSSRVAEITRALAVNAQHATAVAERIEALTGELATTAGAAKQAKESRKRDDDLLASHPDSALVTARASYPALIDRMGAARPTRPEDCATAESALADELYKRIERLNRELGGYGQSLAQYMGDVLRRWPELRAEMDATVEARSDFVAFAPVSPTTICPGSRLSSRTNSTRTRSRSSRGSTTGSTDRRRPSTSGSSASTRRSGLCRTTRVGTSAWRKSPPRTRRSCSSALICAT
jgi:uncharacterized protein YPO0396